MDDHSADTILLRVEKSRTSIPLLRLVIGGVAARWRVSVDQLDDLQLAVETLVVEERVYTGDLELEISVDSQKLRLRLAGLCNEVVRRSLAAADYRPPENRLINVRMLLAALVDDYRVVESAGGCFAVHMEKRTA